MPAKVYQIPGGHSSSRPLTSNNVAHALLQRSRSLVSVEERQGCDGMSLRGVRGIEPPARRTAPVVPPVEQPSVSFGTAAAGTHDRTVARLPIARTRQVTVSKIICGVDVASRSLQARIGPEGPAGRFAN